MASVEPQAQLRDLFPKKDSTAVIWEYFGYEAADEHQKQVRCKTCRAKVVTSSGNKLIPALEKSPQTFA